MSNEIADIDMYMFGCEPETREYYLRKYLGVDLKGNKVLKTLKEFNEERVLDYEYNIAYPKPNGIECPKCGAELNDLDPTVLTSNPPKKNIGCRCGYKGYRIA